MAPRILLWVLLAAVLASQSLLVTQLRRLPSELLGGDLYYQMGCIYSIRDSGNPLASCSTCDALPGYLPLYGTLVALFSRLSGLDVFPSMLVMGVVLKALSVLAVSLMVSRILDRWTGVAAGALWYASHPALLARYSEFAAQVLVPVYLLALYLFLTGPTRRRAILLGVVLALAGYTHAVVFIGSVGIFVATSALVFLREARATSLREVLRQRGPMVGLVLLLTLLALGYWYKPIFVYHGRTSAHYTEWNGGPTLETLADRLAMAGSFFRSQGDLGSPSRASATALVALGALMTPMFWRRPGVRVALLIAGITLIYVFHYFLTQPLLKTHFVPKHAALLLWGGARWLLLALPLAALLGRARSNRARALRLGVLLAGALAVLALETRLLANDPSYAFAKTPLPTMTDSLQRFVLRSTDVNDVFLSANELSFAVSALTGRKVVVTRRAQNDAFIDMDVRNKDAALMLYGRDVERTRALLRRYRIRYLLWTEHWIRSEFKVSPNGGSWIYVDPLLYFENPTYDEELARAGVEVFHEHGWVDPALRTPDVKQFPLSVVSPENYRSAMKPWRENLDPFLEEVWSYQEGGRTTATIYRVKG